jgi:hypothetical protein
LLSITAQIIVTNEKHVLSSLIPKCKFEKKIKKMTEIDIKLNDLSNDRKNLVGTSGSTKIQIIQQSPKTMTKLPERPAVELAFKNLAYRVTEGRSNS